MKRCRVSKQECLSPEDLLCTVLKVQFQIKQWFWNPGAYSAKSVGH